VLGPCERLTRAVEGKEEEEEGKEGAGAPPPPQLVPVFDALAECKAPAEIELVSGLSWPQVSWA
jgi:hypothetical protein